MWVAEFKVWHRNSDIIPKTEKYDVTMSCYYLNTYVDEKGRVHANKVMIANGPDKEKIIAELKNDKDIKPFLFEGGQMFYERLITSDDFNNAYHSLFFDRSIFFLKPMTIKRGFEYWTLGSWDKRNLMRIYRKLHAQKGFATIEIISLKKSKVNIFAQGILATLTQKELEALRIAVQCGYYGSPRKISLEKLCAKLGVPRTTFRSRLRSAEKKLIPGVLEQVTVW